MFHVKHSMTYTPGPISRRRFSPLDRSSESHVPHPQEAGAVHRAEQRTGQAPGLRHS